jgi:hypothetical protein
MIYPLGPIDQVLNSFFFYPAIFLFWLSIIYTKKTAKQQRWFFNAAVLLILLHFLLLLIVVIFAQKTEDVLEKNEVHTVCPKAINIVQFSSLCEEILLFGFNGLLLEFFKPYLEGRQTEGMRKLMRQQIKDLSECCRALFLCGASLTSSFPVVLTTAGDLQEQFDAMENSDDVAEPLIEARSIRPHREPVSASD